MKRVYAEITERKIESLLFSDFHIRLRREYERSVITENTKNDIENDINVYFRSLWETGTTTEEFAEDLKLFFKKNLVVR